MQEDSGFDKRPMETRTNRLLMIALLGTFALLLLGAAAAAILSFSRSQSIGELEQMPKPPAQLDDGSRSTAITPSTDYQQILPLPSPTFLPTPTLFQVGGRSAGDSYIPELGNSGYDVIHYRLEAALDPQLGSVEASAQIEAVSLLAGLGRLSLDFVGFDIESVLVNDDPAVFWVEDKKLIIELGHSLEFGERFNIEIAYQGMGQGESSEYVHFSDHLGLQFPEGDSIYVISEPDGARYWYPANDHPRDKAAFQFAVTVPVSLTAVANGTLVDIQPHPLPDGRDGRQFTWEEDDPMAPYLAVIAVGPYERIESQSPAGVPLRHYVFPEVKEEFQIATAEVGEALDWMSQLLVPYPFDEFGYVTASIPGASMESQTMVLLSEGMIGERTVIHELAHMWFGDWVSLDSWREMWRNEGFATYFQLMWANRDEPEALDAYMDNLKAAVEANEKNYPLNDPPPEYLFEFNVYQKGALLIHALRGEMGDEAFFEGLRLYFERFGGRTASDADFKQVMTEAAGRDLEPFFEQWLPPLEQ